MGKQTKDIEGILCIDKPCGPSSFAVTSLVRRSLGCARAGHAGTLDPGASGLLVIALGEATRCIEYLRLEPKTYRFEARFGTGTDTLDDRGTVIKTGGALPVREDIDKVLPSFLGNLIQKPPAFSSIKINGVRAYRLARQGRQVEPPPRTITVYSLRLLNYDQAAGRALLEAVCSGGTYVRSLVRDLAAALGTPGHSSGIRRTAAGMWSVDNALDPEKLFEARSAIMSAYEALRGMPSVVASEEQVALLNLGRDIILDPGSIIDGGEAGGPLRVFSFDRARRLAAVLRRVTGNRYHPEKVMPQKKTADV